MSGVFIPPEDNAKIIKLNAREQEIFFHYCQGETIEEIAQDLKLSTKTIRKYLRKIRAKLEVDNDIQLLRFAIRTGFID